MRISQCVVGPAKSFEICALVIFFTKRCVSFTIRATATPVRVMCACLFIFGLHWRHIQRAQTHTRNIEKLKKTHRPYEFLYNHFNNRNNSLYFRSRPCDIRHKTQHVYIFRSKRHICDDAHNTFRTPKNRSHTLWDKKTKRNLKLCVIKNRKKEIKCET